MGAGARRNMLRFVRKNPKIISSVVDSGIFFPVILAIASAESGYGTSKAALLRNNIFGIRNGLATFNSLKDAFEFQAKIFYKEPYVSYGVATATTPYQQARAIADAGYYTANNDFNLPDSQRPPYKVWTKKQSADRYYNTIKQFIDDALIVIPFGKITSNNLAAVSASINNSQI